MVNFCYSESKNTEQIAAVCFLLFSEVVSGSHVADSGWCLKAAAVSRLIVSTQPGSEHFKKQNESGDGLYWKSHHQLNDSIW